jgi:hypothetical protein
MFLVDNDFALVGSGDSERGGLRLSWRAESQEIFFRPRNLRIPAARALVIV